VREELAKSGKKLNPNVDFYSARRTTSSVCDRCAPAAWSDVLGTRPNNTIIRILFENVSSQPDMRLTAKKGSTVDRHTEDVVRTGDKSPDSV